MNTNVRELMLAGAHFGHRSRFWNPKMEPYIYGQYHTTHIINLDQTVMGLQKAMEFLQSLVASGGTVLYLCTKNAATEVIEDEARAVKMPYVNRRWLGGMLTNFKTTRNSVDTLTKIENDIAAGALKNMTKKEGMQYIMSQQKLEKAIGGIREMQEPPDALFIIDVGWHKGAVREATKLGIPIVAIVDTNHSPDNIDYIIPGNDDSRLAIEIYTREVSTAIAAGKAEWESKQVVTANAGTAAPEKRRRPSAKKRRIR